MRHVPFFIQKYHLPSKVSFSLLRRFFRAFHERFLVQNRMGALMLLDQSNTVDRHLLTRGVWEQEQIGCLSGLIRKHQRDGEQLIFLDIGAHAALYPIVLCREFSFDRVIAFEPVPSNLAQLKANLWLNHLTFKVEVVEKALSDHDGTVQFIIAPDTIRMQSRILDGTAQPNDTLIEVPVTTVDQTVSCKDCLVVAKVDVEGGELGVLRGMSELLQNNRVLLQIEINTRPLAEVLEILEPMGFRLCHQIGDDYYFEKV